jgi:hypothetical protein
MADMLYSETVQRCALLVWVGLTSNYRNAISPSPARLNAEVLR